MKSLDEAINGKWDKNFPKAIQIETTSRCNARCNFCPYPETSRLFESGTMNDDLFDKVVSELSEFQPLVVAPYLNNEPLLDRKLAERIKQIRRLLPRTHIDLSTNGAALTEKVGLQLLDPELGIDEIKINFPSTDPIEYGRIMGLDYGRTLANVLRFTGQAKEMGFTGRLRVIIVTSSAPEEDLDFWKQEEIEAKVYQKISRGGIIQTEHAPKSRVVGCKYDREKEWLHVLHTGEVILCCMDWYRQHILGDLRKDCIADIWQNERYRNIRAQIRDSADKEFICNKCEWSKPYEK
ncbi:MAG TPA: radical SAM protein [Candidatus Nanoarchaeia archaeon]|nr:radical SAM protein [Candidatus Nanoarchaeia archaeon]